MQNNARIKSLMRFVACVSVCKHTSGVRCGGVTRARETPAHTYTDAHIHRRTHTQTHTLLFLLMCTYYLICCILFVFICSRFIKCIYKCMLYMFVFVYIAFSIVNQHVNKALLNLDNYLQLSMFVYCLIALYYTFHEIKKRKKDFQRTSPKGPRMSFVGPANVP